MKALHGSAANSLQLIIRSCPQFGYAEQANPYGPKSTPEACGLSSVTIGLPGEAFDSHPLDLMRSNRPVVPRRRTDARLDMYRTGQHPLPGGRRLTPDALPQPTAENGPTSDPPPFSEHASALPSQRERLVILKLNGFTIEDITPPTA